MNTFDEWFDYVKEKRGLRDRTIKLYQGNIKKLIEEMNLDIDFDDFDISVFCNEDTVVDIMEHLANMKMHRAKAMLTALLTMLSPEGKNQYFDECEDAYLRFSDLLKSLNNQYMITKSTQKQNKRERENWVPYPKLLKIHEFYLKRAMEKPTKKTVQDALITGLYTKIPPRRLDYADMKFITSKDFDDLDDEEILHHNFVIWDIDPVRLVFGGLNQKSVSDDVFSIALPPDLSYLVGWLRENNKHNDYLFTTEKNNKFSKNMFGILLSNLFSFGKKRVGVTMLRHIFLSHFFGNDSSRNEKQFLADAMNHSIDMQQNVYRKVK